MVLCEELDARWDRVRFVQAAPAAIFGGMVTEASATTRTYFPILRSVGATARTMLIAAAARRWGVEPHECTSDGGEVVHAASLRRLPYGNLAAEAGTIAVPADVPLKATASFRLVGRATPCIDLERKVDGSAVYGLDVRVPEMLAGAIRHAPRFSSHIATVELRSARKMSGVQEIVVLDDAVVVVADTYWHAKRAVDAIHFSTAGGIDADDTALARKLQNALATPGAYGPGTSVDPFAHEAPVLEAMYHFPYLAHATMEPMNCTAVVRDGRCEIWAPTQGRRVAQAAAARITGLPLERVEVHTTYLGGGFGRRSKNDFVEQTVRVAMRLRRPVKLVWSREEDFTHDFYRPAAAVHIRGTVNSAGGVALDACVAAPSLLAAYQPDRFGSAAYDEIALEGVRDTPYLFHALRTSYTRCEPGVPIWFWRSVSNSHNTYALECALDDLARLAGTDGIALRERLLATKPRERAVLQRALALAEGKRSIGTSLGVAFAQMRQTTLAAVAEVSMKRQPASRPFERRNEAISRVRFHQIIDRIDLKGTNGVAIVGGNEDDSRRPLVRRERCKYLERADRRHLDIEKNDRRTKQSNHIDCVRTVRAFGNDRDIRFGLKQRSKPFTRKRLVVDDDRSQVRHACTGIDASAADAMVSARCLRGTPITTSVPPPSRARTRNEPAPPYSASIRRRVFCNPIPARSAAFGGRPAPSSTTRMHRSRSSALTRTPMLVTSEDPSIPC